MASVAERRDLLFGLLALQNGLIDQGQLVAAFQAWSRQKEHPLSEHLIRRGDLDPDQQAAVEALVALHLKKHGGPEQSLASLSIGRSTRDQLESLGDPGLTATLAHLGEGSTELDPERTATHSVGSSTSGDQRFRVLRPHARGGLGAVFVALDAELNREVALKRILEHHADDPSSRSRFLVEAEITGGLEHPGIVPVYGLGVHGDGRPYYAMRFIRGDSLKQAIERFHQDAALKTNPAQSSLALRKLLRRFLDVCNALDYAHSRGVLHRDIKPGNIIIGKYGETLVVDWGLAKATGHAEPAVGERPLTPSSASGSAETLPGSAIGTPAYMPPEQARGDLEALGPRSDVYSLGATLYALLVGKPPFEDNDVGELLGQVQRGELRPPRQIKPSIDKPLEAICLKAMALKPEDRYATARALADDLERWLADERVEAYAEPWTRSLTRWLARHRTAVTAAAAAGIMALIGLALALALSERHMRELEKANTLAEARLDLAMEAVADYHTGVSAELLLAQQGMASLRRRLLEKPAQFYQKLADDPALQTNRSPRSRLLLARGLSGLAKIRWALGDFVEAEAKLREATKLFEEFSSGTTTPSGDTGAQLNLVKLSASAALAELLRLQGKARESLEAAEHALRQLERDGLPIETRDDTIRLRASLLNQMGMAQDTLGRLEDSERSLTNALEFHLKAGPESPDQLSRHAQRAGAIAGNLASRLARRGALDEVRACMQQPIKLLEAAIQHDPSDAPVRNALADTLANYAYALRMCGQTEESLTLLRRAIELHRIVAAEQPNVREFQSDLAAAYLNLGFFMGSSASLEETEQVELQAIDAFRTLVSRFNTTPDDLLSLAICLSNRGSSLTRTDRLDESLANSREAVKLIESLEGPLGKSPDVLNILGDTWGNIGLAHSRKREPDLALAGFRKAVDVHSALVAQYPKASEFRWDLVWARANLGEYLTAQDQLVDAERELVAAERLAFDLIREFPDNQTYARDLGEIVFYLGLLQDAQQRPEQAEQVFERAVQLDDAALARGEAAPYFFEWSSKHRLRLVRARLDLGKLDAAIETAAGFDLFAQERNIPFLHFDAACALALCSNSSELTPARRAELASKAIDRLRAALSADPTWITSAAVDSDLAPLVQNADFQTLVLDPIFPQQPFVDH